MLKKKREELISTELDKTKNEGESEYLGLSKSERRLFKIYFSFVKIKDLDRKERDKNECSELVKELLFEKCDEETEHKPIEMSELMRICNDRSTDRLLNYSIDDIKTLFINGSEMTKENMNRMLHTSKVSLKKKTFCLAVCLTRLCINYRSW